MFAAALAVAVSAQTSLDPMRLPIGRPGELRVELGTVYDLRLGRASSIAEFAAAADAHRFVFLGEHHDNLVHHRTQAEVIEALASRGRDVIVGLEMFTRPVQESLNPWTLGWWTEDEFISRADWKGQWGFDFALYRPIFEAVRRHRLPMVALNVPRDWVRSVGRGGPTALSAEQRSQVPEIDTSNRNHRMVFDSLMGGHPMTGAQGENVYAAQVLWDVAMADSALKYLEKRPPSSRTVFVVIAGSGHVMYGQGINFRIGQRTGETGLTLTMGTAKAAAEVSRGIGDFVLITKEVPRNPGEASKTPTSPRGPA